MRCNLPEPAGTAALRMLAAALLATAACVTAGAATAQVGHTLVGATPPKAAATQPDRRTALIVDDFMDAIAQIPRLGSGKTPLQTLTPNTRFGTLLLRALQDADYDVQIISEKEPGMVQYTIVPSVTDDDRYTFFVAAEGVRLKREYTVTEAAVMPAGSMFVHGASPDGIALDENRFSGQSSLGFASAPVSEDISQGLVARVAQVEGAEERSALQPREHLGAGSNEVADDVDSSPRVID